MKILNARRTPFAWRFPYAVCGALFAGNLQVKLRYYLAKAFPTELRMEIVEANRSTTSLHLPYSPFNMGSLIASQQSVSAGQALGPPSSPLKRYPEAEQAIKKASSIAPLKIDLLTVLTYAQLQNHNYQD